jgi:hypothetical protein
VDYEEFNPLLTQAEFEIFYLPKTIFLSTNHSSIKEASGSGRRKISPKKFMPIILLSKELYRDLVKQNRNNIMLTSCRETPRQSFQKIVKLIRPFSVFLLQRRWFIGSKLYKHHSLNGKLADFRWMRCYMTVKQYFRY